MYEQQLSTVNPGLILILLDQSGSMRTAYADRTKAEFAALAVNRVIGEIIQACTAGDNVKDRCHLGVIGYGSKAELLFISSASQLAENTQIMNLPKLIPDGAGGVVQVNQILRVFVPAISNGSTDMAGAFGLASQGVEKFIGHYPDSFPPIVINITDGEPDDFDKASLKASQLAELATSDGSVIIMNAYVSNDKDILIQLPSDDTAFSTNKFAKFLYSLSSVLPEAMLAEAINSGFSAKKGARGFIFNADPDTLIRFLRFGTAIESAIVPATNQ